MKRGRAERQARGRKRRRREEKSFAIKPGRVRAKKQRIVARAAREYGRNLTLPRTREREYTSVKCCAGVINGRGRAGGA